MKQFGLKGGQDRPKMLKNQIEGKINSWAIRRGFTQFLQNKYTIFPYKTLVKNIGHDGSGVHCGSSDLFDIGNKLLEKNISLSNDLIENKSINKQIYNYYTTNIFQKIIRKINKVVLS